MLHFRFRYEVKGGHVHIRLFAGKSSKGTLGKCGDLCMTVEEFEQFKDHIKHSAFEFKPEGEGWK